jgi:membrane protein
MRRIATAFSENALVVFANAIAFRMLLALVPFALFVVALLGFLQLEEVWRDSWAPEIRERTSQAAFTLIDRTAERIFTRQEGFWLTAGAALAFWEVSAAIRVTMRALDRIYETRRRRSTSELLAVSFALAPPVAACLLGAFVSAQFVPPLFDRLAGGTAGEVAGLAIGWGLSAVLTATAIALLVRFAPSRCQPFRLVGTASILVIVVWGLTSALFGLYATRIASYGSVFGGLAFAFILMTYLYLTTMTFVAGLQVDAFLRGLARESE